MSAQIAIVGSGPAGFYTAEAIVKSVPQAKIDIIESLPTPFGLVRYGVAPDHQSIKNVSKAFEKTALTPEVRFLGNVTIGRDVTVAELQNLYDAVVIATGAPEDRNLGIDGTDMPGVIGSAAFVGWYNCHPRFADLNPDLGVAAAAVIGVGNVALDVARVLAKSPEELAAADIAPYAAAPLKNTPIRDIYVIGRRGPLEASFTPQELKEFGTLTRAVPLVDPAQLPETADAAPENVRVAKKKNLAILQDYAANSPEDKPVRIHFLFYARPEAILGTDRVEEVKLERTTVSDGRVEGTGEAFGLSCGLVVPCIGYKSQQLDDLPFDERRGCFVHEDGVIAPGLYAAGWARRGPTGTIATNRADGTSVAAHIHDHVTPDPGKAGGSGLDRLLEERGVTPVTYEDWQTIEAAEQAAAEPPAPRRKFPTVGEMLRAAHTKDG